MTYEEAEALIREHMDYGGNVKVHTLATALAALESRVLAEKSQGEKAASEDVRTARYEWMLKMLMADGWTERGIDKEIAAIAGEKK